MIQLLPRMNEFKYRAIKKKYPEKVQHEAYYDNCIIAFDKEYNEIVKIPHNE